jgi:hypothetical protein
VHPTRSHRRELPLNRRPRAVPEFDDAGAVEAAARIPIVRVARAVWGKETRFSCRLGAVFGSLCCVGWGGESRSRRGRPARGCNPRGGLTTLEPLGEPFARAGNPGVSLVRRAHAIASMIAMVRPSSRREKAQRRLPTAAADLMPAARRARAPRHRWWRPPRLPLRGVPLPALQPSSRTRCARGRHRARRGDRRRACSVLGRAGTQTSWGRSAAAPARPETRGMVATVAVTLIPSFSSSPWMRI